MRDRQMKCIVYDTSCPCLHEPATLVARFHFSVSVFSKKYFVPNNASLYLAGDLPENIEEIVDGTFSDIERGKDVKKIEIPLSKKMTLLLKSTKKKIPCVWRQQLALLVQ